MSARPHVIHSRAFAVDAANIIAESAQDAIRERGAFRLSLSGGNTPRLVYAELAGRSAEMDWSKVLITFGDERCVPPDDAQSNYRMARESLFDAVSIPEQNILRILGELSPEAAAAECDGRIAELAARSGEARFVHDLLLLGLGPDGHTASLFPETAALEEQRRNVVANHVPKLNADRITFTYPLINAARHVLFLIKDADKLPVLEEIWRGDSAHPAARVQPVSGRLTWLLGF